MIDFLHIRERQTKNGVVEIYADYHVRRHKDLMIRGGDFYAIWNEEIGLWSTDPFDAIDLIDKELDIYANTHRDKIDAPIRVRHLAESSTKAVNDFYNYCKNQMRDTFVTLDTKLTFSNTQTVREDYVSMRLPYPLQEGDISAYDRLMSVLYSPKERHKIEWAIGSIVAGDSINIQKFIVLYGPPKSGKSTVLNIIDKMFTCEKKKDQKIGYVSVFDAKSLGSSNNSFALEAFHSNPLVGIQHDGDLSRIEDNTRLNSLVSHETMLVNEKYEKARPGTFNCFLFMGTNKPVKITDAKSGLLRRLIDVTPTGNTVPIQEYNTLKKQIAFEYGAIAWHCREVYLSDPHCYDNYTPSLMLGASNDFYNFMLDSFFEFKREDGISLNAAYEMYDLYCKEAKVPYPYPRRQFGEELKNYFSDFKERATLPDGSRPRSYYSGFLANKFEFVEEPSESNSSAKPKLILTETKSVFDDIFKDCPAQYATKDKTPRKAWANVTTILSDIDTSKLHYVKPPENVICIDFDIPGEDGEKNLDLNLTRAAEWPATYSELSQSGKAVHLYYIYDGDVTQLAKEMEPHIEIKVFTGGSALRRKVILCNALGLAHIASNLPLRKEKKKVIDHEGFKNEQKLRSQIEDVLRKKNGMHTTPGIDFIKHLLDEAYESGKPYNVQDLRPRIVRFAMDSTHQAERCLDTIPKMHFCSQSEEIKMDYADDSPIIFFDCEVYPNLFVVCWKERGPDHAVVKWINPTASDIQQLFDFRLVGFNNLNYDNYILYYASLGKSPSDLYLLSKKIIANKVRDNLPYKARALSYTDIYDFCSKKQSLKKWEIELGLHHKEMGIPWNKPVAVEMWDEVADYCANDVMATEAVFEARAEDFATREMLVVINKILNPKSRRTVNDTTNSLSGDILFGDDKNPQRYFRYRNLAEKPEVGFTAEDVVDYALGKRDIPLGLPYFPGYIFENGKSTYRGYEIGEGGRVYANHGIWYDVDDEDVSSMHPSSLIAENLFGKYTERYASLVDIRIAIKHKDYDKVRGVFNGALAPYLTDEKAKGLANALKIVLNSAYGLTSRKASDKTIDRGGVARFRDIRNVDNIVAKRGALFMTDLQWALETYFPDYPVVHIKTDSIKVAGATPEVVEFIRKFGEAYGYSFEQEAHFERLCLVNDAVYIARLDNGQWTATGAQFQVPYVFKRLFSGEPIEFRDYCETKSVSTALYLDMNEDLSEDEHNYIFVGRVGQFTPVISGGGELLRAVFDDDENITGYSAVVGTKGYRWLESEQLRLLGKEDIVDLGYYNKLVDEAIDTISKFGDPDEFVRISK